MVKINKQLVSSRAKTYNGTNGRKYITIHETANTGKGANAQAHANLQSNGFSESWHYSVDDKQAIQSFPHSVRCWHAGDGKGNGNYNSIGIEICVNSDGNFKKATDNAAALTKKIMKEENIPLENVVQHNKWSGKNCPTFLRSGSKGIDWSDFKNKVDGKEVKPSKPTKPATGGVSLVDYLKAQGKDASYANRAKLAKQHGIKNYKGTAKQNTKLLKKLKGGNSKPAKKYPLPSGTLKVGSRGNKVKKLQRALNAVNFKCGSVDGIFGAKTKDAVERFQKVHDPYRVDGIYGKRTKKRLKKALK